MPGISLGSEEMTLKRRIEKIEERLKMKEEGETLKPLIVSLPNKDGKHCPLKDEDHEKCPTFKKKWADEERKARERGGPMMMLTLDCCNKDCPYAPTSGGGKTK